MLKTRILVVSVFFCLMFAGAVARLIDLQFKRSSQLAAYRDARLSHIEQKAPRRGRILDAAGEIIAEDQPTQDVWLVPARAERVGRRREIVSNLLPLSVDQMYSLATMRGAEREFEFNLALASLEEGGPLVESLAARLGLSRREVALKLLSAAASGRPSSRDDLTQPRRAFDDVDFALALEIRSARANPYDDGRWRALEVRTGGKRFYPAGPILGHLTGTVGKLTAEEYEELRGRWNGDGMIPGKGVLTKQGRIFFSILSDKAGALSDEALILRLREFKRAGKMVKTQGYLANENVGRGGLEQYYNQALRGRHRLQRLELTMDRDSGRRRFEPKGDPERAQNGADIRLSLRLDVQRRAQEIMQRHIEIVSRRPDLVRTDWEKSGVAIMMDPRNGRIHALVSLPTYDPNTFNRDFKKLLEDPAQPLLDRALAGIYPPGSVVKPLVGLAGLTEERIMPGERFTCDHVLMLGGARFTCLGRHGEIDLETALMHSCNIYFYHVGEALGGRRLYDWYSRFGLGHRTGIDVAGETDGILPRAAYTRRGWATGNTYHMAIGQGIAVTPLQIAVAYSALANAQGNVARIVRPHLLATPLRQPATPVEEELAREAYLLDQPVAEVMVDPEAIATIRHGMWEVVQGRPEGEELGSGRNAAFPIHPEYTQYGNLSFRPSEGFLLEIAGKTGTAEWSRVVDGVVRKQVSHVWFAAYAPFDRPELVVVVMLPEAGGGGGGTCAPIAKDLIRMWFNVPERSEYDGNMGEDALG